MTEDSVETGEWEQLLAAERRLQGLVPGSVLVGGTAAALHARHRLSVDGDHVLPDLREKFDDIQSRLEKTLGWKTERVRRPVMILGELDGFLTGVRQLRRVRPLETEVLAGLTVPTLAEMARIKGWLLLTRNTMRDYLDTVVLMEKLGDSDLKPALAPFDDIYGQGPGGGTPGVELIDCLAAARPADRESIELSHYKGVVAPWNDWTHVASRGRFWAGRLAAIWLEP